MFSMLSDCQIYSNLTQVFLAMEVYQFGESAHLINLFSNRNILLLLLGTRGAV
jgi:hypothetical protein